MSEERRERFSLGHKKEISSERHDKNYDFFQANHLFYEGERAKVRFALKQQVNLSCHSSLKSAPERIAFDALF